MRSCFLELYEAGNERVFKALSSETRLKLLRLLTEREMNINELGQALGVMHPTVSKHVQALEEAGLVASAYIPGAQGMQKRCRLNWDRLVLSLGGEIASNGQFVETEMPVGLYTEVEPVFTCGLAGLDSSIGVHDDPQSFFLPERVNAQILWSAGGFVEYRFPNRLPTTAEVTRVELSAEVCSEAPGYRDDHPSDITIWINGREVGTWTCPGDFGGSSGWLNPPWWQEFNTQFGTLKVWSVTQEGSFVDGMALSSTRLADLSITPRQAIRVRIGNKPDAEHLGGFNLFGKGFGNHRQDLNLRLHYITRRQALESNGGRDAPAE